MTGLYSSGNLSATFFVGGGNALTNVQGSSVTLGNLISNIDRRTLEKFADGRPIAVEVGGTDVPRLVATYAEAAPREICALFGSTDHLEVAVNAGDAAAVLGLGRGTPARVRLVR